MTRTDRTYPAARLRTFRRDQGACVLCGRPGESIHHRQGRGGKDPHRLSNLITVCGDGTRGDHARIHANPAASYAYGWMVPRLGILTTQAAPIQTTNGWVLLHDDGTITPTEAPA